MKEFTSREGTDQITSSTLSTFLIRPKRIILVRHAESIGNIDENAYTFIPDWKIP